MIAVIPNAWMNDCQRLAELLSMLLSDRASLAADAEPRRVGYSPPDHRNWLRQASIDLSGDDLDLNRAMEVLAAYLTAPKIVFYRLADPPGVPSHHQRIRNIDIRFVFPGGDRGFSQARADVLYLPCQNFRK